MNRNQLVSLGVTSVFSAILSISGSLVSVSANSTTHQTTIAQAQSGTQSGAVLSGTFTAAEKPTTGNVQIINENGKRYVVLDKGFKASKEGPDLHVLLDTAEQPPAKYENKTSYVNLGKLKKYAGSQRYAIPASVDVANYKSVVIWCQTANATFGYATLH